MVKTVLQCLSEAFKILGGTFYVLRVGISVRVSGSLGGCCGFPICQADTEARVGLFKCGERFKTSF